MYGFCVEEQKGLAYHWWYAYHSLGTTVVKAQGWFTVLISCGKGIRPARAVKAAGAVILEKSRWLRRWSEWFVSVMVYDQCEIKRARTIVGEQLRIFHFHWEFT